MSNLEIAGDLGSGFGLFNVVGNQHVAEDGARLDLPQVKADGAQFLPGVELGVSRVFGVVNLRVNPGSLERN